ncbi:hypothetical protein Bca101_014878 [Brassica carinata]
MLISSSAVSAQLCFESSGLFTPNGAYNVNRRALLSSLPSSVTANNGFYITLIGQDPNRAYGLGMCIPGSDRQNCSNCIYGASNLLITICPNQTEGVAWIEALETFCMKDPIRQVNLKEFDNAWESLMHRVIDEQQLGTSLSIYGFVQCSKDISASNCDQRLRQNVDNYSSCCSGTQRGITERPSCFMRWDLDPFFGLLDENISSPTPPPEKSDRTISIGVVVGITGILTFVISEQEFTNEVLLVTKLQHRNLVRLLGFSVEGAERILVYEFVPNKSLNYFLFDPIKRIQLDWKKCYNIIRGITRGMLYLHQHSRLTVVRRDLKASNILLDTDMNPKIADFRLARNFTVDQTEANTGRVVGTVGYMPPEYVANGQFSTKSDVYSFGVLILEIIGGKKNSSFHQIDGSLRNLVTYVGFNPAIGDNYDKHEVIRCIHIGLLCVQENPADRPTMSTIFQMLTNTSITLHVPQPPGFFFRDEADPLAEGLTIGQSSIKSFACSVDDASITSVNPR